MKKKIKNGYVYCIIALITVIGFSLVGCSEPKDDPPPVPSLTALTGTVSITGSAEVGQTLTADTSSLGGSGTITYQWKRGTANIGTNNQTYQVQAADVGSAITVTVTRSGYSGSVTSAPTAAVTASNLPVLTGTVSIFGFAAVDETLTADTVSLGGSGTISYQWKRGSANIGTNSETYKVQAADVGSTITVTVTRTGNSGGVTSPATAVVTDELPPTPGLAYTLIGSYYSVSRGTATAENVVIPTLYEGLPVTTIGDFSGYRTMKSIRIPNRVTTIGSSAFTNCSGLKIVNISDSVMTIGSSAFSNCTGLEIVTIPDSVTSIGSNAFSNCTDLETVTIPSSVTNIDNGVFTNCSALTKITIPFSGLTPNGTYNFGYLFGTSSYSNQNTSIPALLKTVIVTGGNSVPENTFYECSNLTSITLPNSVQSIGQSAFYGCSGLTSFTIPDNVTSIGDSAFRNCTSLESITLPFIGKSKNATTYEAVFGYIFGYNSYSSSGAIQQYSGYYYYIPTSLKTVIITSGNSVPAQAFFGCANLTSITIPNSVQSIGNYAFYNCSGLTSITVESGNTTYRSEGNCLIQISDNMLILGCKTSVIPNSVTSIGQYAFQNCTGMTSITIPNNVQSIGQWAFSGCTGLTTINFNATAIADLYDSGVFDKVGQNAGGITVTIGVNVTKIPAGLFSVNNSSNSPKITAVNFTEGSVCQSIGSGAFSGCTGLASVTIPNSVTSCDSAFYNWTGLASVTINNAVIGNGMFSGCTGLTSVTIPNNVQSIGIGAFRDCTNLTSVTIGNGVQSIGDNAFRDCTNLTSVTINNAVIGESMFSGCTGLMSVTIPNNVQSIGGGAFSGCTGLTSVTISNNVQSIGDGTFSGCTGLTSVTIPNSVQSIGYNAFSGCTGLASVTFAGTIPSSGFDYYAFGGSSTIGDLMTKFYAADSDNGTPGTYTRGYGSNSNTWTKQ